MEKEIKQNERILKRIQHELIPLKKEEAEARRLWSLGYNKFLTANKKLQQRIASGLTVDPVDTRGVENKTVKKLWDTISGWDERSAQLTKLRDIARLAMEVKKSEILEQEKMLSQLLHDYQIQTQQTDGMIDKVFILNDGVVTTLQNMDKYLSTDVFPLLHEKATQKMIENSSSTKKIVIMTNSMNIMDLSKVEEAKVCIDLFFKRLTPETTVQSEDDTIVMLSDLLKELLDVKVRVKAGPNLSKFLSLELSEEKFSELRKAQRLLASATNYVRSGKYVRLYLRGSQDDIWQPVRQS